ncbi:autotransporter domain-containing protein [Ahrensia marina]|uniref:autotransporter outer membrane beta-barrel domain-containing protein n=1 Tax=Ahrensia marina TaxID=1514904 RepID=UPI0035CEB047
MQGRFPKSAAIATKLARQLAVAGSLALSTTTAPSFFLTSTALAACSPALANGAVLVCQGTTESTVTNVLGTGTETNVTVTVEAGATIRGTGVGVNHRGIYLGADAQITNLGSIESSYEAISIFGDLINLSNTGTIIGSDRAIQVVGNISDLTNHGTIQGTVFVFPGGGRVSNFINHSSVLGGDGALFASNIDSLFNAGLLRASINAVWGVTGLSSLINSGTIEGGTRALYETGAVDTNLTLNAGSVIIGRIDLGGGTNILHVGEGLSVNSTFESDGGATEVGIGTLHGHLAAVVPVVGNGNNDVQIVAVDSSALTSLDDTLAALTSGIGQKVQSRQSTMRSDPALGFASSFASRFAAADETRLAAFSDLDLDNTPPLNPGRFWIEGFGAYREDDSDRVGRTFESLTGGLVAGVDVPLDAITSVGVMAGFAASTSENEIDTQETDTTSYYAGVYASTEAWGLAWDGALTLGYTDYDQERVTVNNLVATGLETASADFGGWFINPQVTVTNSTSTGFSPTSMGSTSFALPTIEQSLTLAYAGLFLDGTTETGTTNPLTLDDRDVHIASARAALALPFEALHANGALTTIRLIGGIETRTQFGDDGISGTLLGQTVSTTLDDDDTALGGFLGLSGEYQTSSGLTAYANAEAMLETNSAYQISATAGLRIAF